MLADFKTRGENIEQVAREMKNTLITGPGQKQGAWGQMVLEIRAYSNPAGNTSHF